MHRRLPTAVVLILAPALALAPTAAAAADPTPGPVHAHVVRVIDGDTLVAKVKPWCP